MQKNAWMLSAVLAATSLPALAQTTTTTTQGAPAQPPPSTTTVVVQPGNAAPAAGSAAPREVTEVQTDRRSVAGIIATDALYGGLTGVLIGGGIALIENGHNWGRDLTLGAGIGVLAGAGVGAIEAAATVSDRHGHASRDVGRDADRPSGTPALQGPQLAFAARF